MSRRTMFLGGLLLLLVSQAIHADIITLDMESTAICTMTQMVPVGPSDTVVMYAEPTHTGQATRDRCTVKFIGLEGRKFKLFIRDLWFGECEIYVKMYDGDMNLNQAKYKFGCNNNAGGLYYSYNDQVAISLEKSDASSYSYKFFLKMATTDGPDIGGEAGGESKYKTDAIGTGTIAGIAVGGLVVLGAVVAVVVYCVCVYRRKQEEKQLAMSMSTLFQSSKGDTYIDGSSVASSRHSTHSTYLTQSGENKAYTYPAFRTQSISEKHPTCDSIDTRSYDSDGLVVVKVDNSGPKPKSILVKGGTDDIRAMKKSLIKHDRDKEKEEAELRRRAAHADKHREELRRMRDIERGRGLGRSAKNQNNRPLLNEDNIRESLRSARDRGKLTDRASKTGSSRSRVRSHSAPRSAPSYTDYDGYSDRSDHKSRHKQGRDVDRGHSSQKDRNDRHRHGNVHRSSSTQSRSRTKHDNYDDRDAHSDYDEHDHKRRRSRHRYDDDYSDDGHYSSHETGHTHRRSRSQSHTSSRR